MIRKWPAAGAVVVPLLALAVGLPASAQPQAVIEPAVTEEILIIRGTPERRFTAPLSAVTLRGQDARRNATLDEVAIAVPGLSMINDQDPGTNIVALRGVTTDRLQQAAVALIVDGVALADTELFTGPLFDLEAIEVLRGPQGALFGKGAAGGVIAITTRADGPGSLSLSLGNGGERAVRAAQSFALPGNWQGRAAGQWRAADGWLRNSTLDRIVDAEESRAVRLRLAGPLSPGVRLDLAAQWLEEDGGAAWASSGNVTGPFGGRLAGAALTDPIGDFEGRASRTWGQVRGSLEARLGPGQLTFRLARDDYAKRFIEELDYRPGALTFFGLPLFPEGLQPIRQPVDLDATTAELRWQGAPWAGAGLTVGVFGQDLDRQRVDDFGPLLFGAPAPLYRTDSQQTAAFAGLSQRLGRWQVEAQARYDQDRRRQRIFSRGTVIDQRQASFGQWQPRLGVSYAPTQNSALYVAYGEGFRSGGFNPLPPAGAVWQAQFGPETTSSLEAGVRLRGTGWRAEVTGFAADIADYQNYTFLDGQSVTLTVDAVEVRGGEISAEVTGDLGAGWRGSLAGGAALALAEIRRYRAPDPLRPGAVRDYSGRTVPNAPAWTATVTGDLRRGSFTAALTVNATGDTVFEIDNALRAPAKAWADLRLGYDDGPWGVALAARNVTDERWAISAFGQGMLPLLAGLGPDGPFDTFTLNRGRQIAVTLSRSLP